MLPQTSTDVLRVHQRLYEALASPPQDVLRFYDDFFGDTALKALRGDEGLQSAWVSMLTPARDGAGFFAMLRKPLYAAPTFHVSRRIVNTVSDIYHRAEPGSEVRFQHADLPPGPDGSPAETGFVWLDEPVYLTDAGGTRVGTRAFSWGPQPPGPLSLDGIRLTTWFHAGDADSFTPLAAMMLLSDHVPLSLSHSQQVPYGQAVAVHGKDTDVAPDDVLRWVHCLWVFMGTEIVTAAPAVLPRPARRQAAASIGTSTVSVVLLRRVARVGEELPVPRQVDWSCCWVVQSHLRHIESYEGVAERHHAIVSGGDKDHCAVCGARVTRVRAYVKGPEGLPLKPVPETVYKVTR